MQIRFFHSLGLRMPPHSARSGCESARQMTGPASLVFVVLLPVPRLGLPGRITIGCKNPVTTT